MGIVWLRRPIYSDLPILSRGHLTRASQGAAYLCLLSIEAGALARHGERKTDYDVNIHELQLPSRRPGAVHDTVVDVQFGGSPSS